MRLKVWTVTCPLCQEEIYSRARHDWRHCSCGRTYVDGGFDYFRFGYPNTYVPPKTQGRFISATKKLLYRDWQLGTNLFGVIKRKSK